MKATEDSYRQSRSRYAKKRGASQNAAGMVVGEFELAVLGLALGVFGVAIAIYQTYASKKLEKSLLESKITYSWDEVDILTTKIAAEIARIKPQFIVVTPGASTLICSLVIEKLYAFVPLHYVLYKANHISDWLPENSNRQDLLMQNFEGLTPANYGYTLYFPKWVTYPKGKIVLLTDVSISLQPVSIFANFYCSKGYSQSDMTWISMFAHKTFVRAIAEHRSRGNVLPKVLHMRLFNSDRLILPWAIDEGVPEE